MRRAPEIHPDGDEHLHPLPDPTGEVPAPAGEELPGIPAETLTRGVVAFALMRIQLALVLFLALAACGANSEATAPTTTPKADADQEEPSIQSNDILARDALVKKAQVKHILIGWKDLAKNYGNEGMDPRAKARTRAEADELAVKILERVRAGEDIDALMAQYSEDTGSAKTAAPYDVTVDAQLVFTFKRLSLRLKVGEAGLVQTVYGWHIIKRVE
jgi:PPIC-type PPIASE domain